MEVVVVVVELVVGAVQQSMAVPHAPLSERHQAGVASQPAQAQTCLQSTSS